MKILVSLILLLIGGFSSNASTPKTCFSYEPATVFLKGKITRNTFAGSPNYDNIKKGDTPERYWILNLIKPICVISDPNIIGGEKQENNVSKIQLALTEAQYVEFKGFRGKQVEVSGKLWHAHTGHHHTNVLITVTEIKDVPLSLAAQTTQPVRQQIKICRLTLTELGSSYSFRFQYIVAFTTKKDGTIENIKKIRWGGEGKILNSENIIPCIKTWILKPQKKYVVQISYGTTLGKNVLIVTNTTDKETIEIEL